MTSAIALTYYENHGSVNPLGQQDSLLVRCVVHTFIPLQRVCQWSPAVPPAAAPPQHPHPPQHTIFGAGAGAGAGAGGRGGGGGGGVGCDGFAGGEGANNFVGAAATYQLGVHFTPQANDWNRRNVHPQHDAIDSDCYLIATYCFHSVS